MLIAVLLAIPGCSDGGKSLLADGATRTSAPAELASLTPAPPIIPPEIRAAAGTYRIDAKATGQTCGFLASIVTTKVTGLTLQLADDLTYFGCKDGVPECKGTWEIEAGQLTMVQTHEQGKPVPNRCEGTIQNGALRVKVNQSGLDVTLVFHRQ